MFRYQPPKDWQEWVEGLAAGWHGRSCWRLSLILLGMVFARGRRRVTTWLRAVAIKHDFADYDYFLPPLGRKSKKLALRLFTKLAGAIIAGTLHAEQVPSCVRGP